METIEDRAWCEACAVRAIGHGRRRVVVRDLPMAGRPVALVWAKRLWRCPEPTCPVRCWSEEVDEIAPRAVLTGPAREEICRRVGPAQHSVAQATRNFGVSWHTAMAAVREHGRLRVDHLARLGAPAAVGPDETSFLAATAEHPTMLVTGIIHLDRGRLADVLPARSAWRSPTGSSRSRPRGTEVKSAGDGFMLAFADVTDALDCAIAIQRAIATAEVGGERIRIRMGLHTGEVIREDDDCFGRTVIVAARVAALARGGEVLATDDVPSATNDDDTWGPARETPLKGLAGTHRVSAARW